MSNAYNYARRGNRCTSQTCALTSNAKFILPLSAVYFKPWTKMMNYPGHDSLYTSGTTSVFNDVTEPKHIKAYDRKDSLPPHHHEEAKDHTRSSPIQQIRKGCSGCSFMYTE